MCNPAAIIGGVASVAGAAVQAQQQQAYVNAQNDANRRAYEASKKAREQELARQRQYESEALTAWDETAQGLDVGSHEQAQAEAGEQFMENFDDQASVLPEGFLLSGQDQASDEIRTEIASRANQTAAETRKRVQALAALSSYGNADLQRGTALGNNANKLSTIGGLRRGSLGVSQQEQTIGPASVTPGSSIFGDVLSGAGGIVSSYGGGPRVPSSNAMSRVAAGSGGLY